MHFKTMTEKSKDWIILYLLFLLAFIIRLLLISKGPFYVDTVELAKCAENTLKTLNLHYMHWAGYPFTVVTASIFIALMKFMGINDAVLSVNFMSVMLGSLGVAVFYLISKRFWINLGPYFLL